MLALALDQSTTRTGWCVGRLDTMLPTVEDGGVFSASGANWVEHLCDLEAYLRDVLCVLFERGLSVAAYEIPTMKRNVRTVRRLGAAEFVVLRTLIPHVEVVYGFDTSKVAHSGFGKHGLEATARLVGHTPTEDEADAIAVYVLLWKTLNGMEQPTETYTR